MSTAAIERFAARVIALAHETVEDTVTPLRVAAEAARRRPTWELQAEREYWQRRILEFGTATEEDHALAELWFAWGIVIRLKAIDAELTRRAELDRKGIQLAATRFDGSFVADLKSRVHLPEFIVHHQPQTYPKRASGDRHLALCCFHSERTPSLSIWLDHYHCFGCGVSGDAFTFCEDTGLADSFTASVRYVAQWAGVSLPDPRPTKPESAAGAPTRRASGGLKPLTEAYRS